MFKYLVTLFLVTRITNSLPNGAPTSVCETMMPFHSQGLDRQHGPSPYAVIPALTQLAENSRLKVSMGSWQGVTLGGFMMQARDENRKLIGTFVELPPQARPIDCSAPGDTVTHVDPKAKGPILEFEWMPPENYRGIVIFNATIAQNYQTFWVGIESNPVQILKRSEITVPQGVSTPPPSQFTTPPHFNPTVSSKEVQNDDPFYSGCFEVKGCFGAPDGCVRNRNCKVVVATIVRGDRYEFELKGSTEAAYVAVGLSNDVIMGDDSVIECVRDRNGVRAYMSRTIARPNLGVERLPKLQSHINLLNYSLTDGELYCRVSRDAMTTVDGKEYNLISGRFFLLVAAGRNVTSNKVTYHDITRLAAGQSRYLSDVSEVAAASKILLRLHGAFMLIAWMGTTSIGILLARYYRQTWVGRQLCGKDMWFAWHRFFMVCTWSLTIVGFILIFVELKAWSSETNPHAILGLVTTILCCIQPLGAFFRPHPGTPKRPIFNWLHWLGGNVAHILAIVTIFFAVKLTKAELPEWVDWILVGYVAFHVCMHLILSLMSWLQILGCISDRAAESRITSFPMKDLGTNGRAANNFDRKADAPNAGLRKFLLGVFLLVIILFVVALVVIIVMAPIEETWANLRETMKEKS